MTRVPSSSRLGTHTRVAALVLVAVYALFVFGYEQVAHRAAQARVEEHARVVAEALWNYNVEGVAEYLALACESDGYGSLVVLHENGEVFYEIECPAPGGLEGALLSGGLVSRVPLQASVIHGVERIGRIRAVWYCDTILPDLYVLLAFTLLGAVFHLSARLVQAKHALEHRVRMRTMELEEANEHLVREVGERKRAESALAEREAFLDSIVDNLPNMLFVKDAGELRFVRFNRAGEELLGESREQLLGRNDYDLFPRDQADFFTAKDREVLASKRLLDIPEELIETRSGGRRVLHTKKIPILGTEGEPLYLMGISEDITDRLMLEQQLAQAQKMEAIGTLAGGIAHDFNNILSAVMGYAELAQLDLAEPSRVQGHLDKVLLASKRAQDLVTQILAFSRRSRQETRPTQIRPIAEEALKLLRASLPTTIRIESSLSTEAHVRIDPTKAHQIFMNLCANAGHAMRESGGRLDVTLEQVELNEAAVAARPGVAAGRYLRLGVADTGSGMPPEVRDRVFEPFFTTKGQGEGTGMGLSVVHGIVRECGGFIEVDSAPGKGTVFSVYLPVAEPPAVAPAEEGVAERDPRGTERILFVDDEPMQCALVHEGLKHLGYRLTSFESSREALSAFEWDPTAFDVVVTDMTMPELTGDALAKHLRQTRPDVPIVLCTGFSDRIDEARAEALGIDAFLYKPIALRDLARQIRRLCDRDGTSAPQEP